MSRIASKFIWSLSAWSLGAALATAQSTWRVDAAAAPGGDGSVSSPFSAIQVAIDAPTTLHGDTLLVAPGIYVENVEMRGKRITVRADGGPTLTTLRAAGAGPVALLDATGCFLEGFTVTGALSGPAILVPVVGEGNAWIRRCIVTGNAGVGIAQNYDAQIHSCTIWGNGGAGVQMGTLAVLTMANCIVAGNGAPSGTFTGFGTSVEWCVLDNGFCPHCDNLFVDP